MHWQKERGLPGRIKVFWKKIPRKCYPIVILVLMFSFFTIIKRLVVGKSSISVSNALDKDAKIHRKLSFASSGDLVNLPSKELIANMSYDELSSLYHRYVNSLQYNCKSILRLGTIEDGGWDVCDDYEFRPKNSCVVYSFGIDNDFSFDEAVVKRYGCEVHSFDPSMKEGEYVKPKTVTFHDIGLSHENQRLRGKQWKMKTLKTIRRDLDHVKIPIDILKLDIEEWEWFALPEMIYSGSIKDVKQLNIELHLSIKILPNYKRYLRCLYILKDLHDLGFRIFWTHRNLWCTFYWGDVQRTGCHEVSMVRLS